MFRNINAVYYLFKNQSGAWGDVVVQALRYYIGRSWDRFPVVLLDFFSDIFPSDRTVALGVDSGLSENEYQVHFLGVKAAGA